MAENCILYSPCLHRSVSDPPPNCVHSNLVRRKQWPMACVKKPAGARRALLLVCMQGHERAGNRLDVLESGAQALFGV